MKITSYLQQSSNLFAANQLLRFVIVVLSGCLVFTSFMTYRADLLTSTLLRGAGFKL